MKNFFLFSLSIAILCICGTSGFLLWKTNKTQNEIALVAKEKRARLDEYYDLEFRTSFSMILDAKKPMKDLIIGGQWRDEIEANMLKDGYDRAEIDSMKMRTHKTISDQLERKGQLRNFG